MKPRLYRKWGIWCCADYYGAGTRFNLGYGYTPRHAYDDWLMHRNARTA